MFPDWTEAAGKRFVRLRPVRVRWDGRERQDWPAGERFVTQKSAERQKPKKKKKAPTTAEREPRIKTILPAAEK